MGALRSFFTTTDLGLWRVVSLLALLLTPATVTAQCPPGSWVVSGNVVGPQGEAIVAADIDVFLASTGAPLTLSGDFTDGAGNFALTICQSVPVGLYDIVINPPAGTAYFDGGISGQFLSGSTSVGTIILQSGSLLTGQVVNDQGVGLEEVDLNFFDPVTRAEVLFSGDITDAAGNFAVLVTTAFYDIEFRVTPGTNGGPYVPVYLRDRALFSDLDVGVIVFHDAHYISGTVFDPGGSPVASGDIDVRDPVTGEKIYTPGDNTDGSGSFLVGAPVGSWDIEIDPPLGSSLVAQLIPIVLPPGGISMGNIVLPVGVAVTGTTVDVGGSSVAEVDLDFIISATSTEIPTVHDNADGNGDFSVQVETDTYDIEFRPPFITGLAPRVLLLVVVQSDTDLGQVVLEPGFAITGVVTSSGTPVEGAMVSLNDSATGVPVYTFGDDTDGLGMYGIRQVSGTYDVTFTPPPGSGLSTLVRPSEALFSDITIDVDLGPGGTPPPGLDFFGCVVIGSDVGIGWINGAADYDSIQVFRDGVQVATLPGDSNEYNEFGMIDGTYFYQVIPIRNGLAAVPSECTVVVSNSTVPAPVLNLVCTASGADVDLVWQNADPDYDAIEIGRDGLVVAILAGSLTAFNDPSLADGTYLYTVIAIRAGLPSTEEQCLVTVSAGPPVIIFVRGDSNNDSTVNLADAIYILAYLFVSGSAPPCFDALDPNDSGSIDVADAVFLLAFLFSGGDQPPPPFPTAGTDPTPDGLPCP